MIPREAGVRCEWREENGLRFLAVDYRDGLSEDEMLAVLEQQVGANVAFIGVSGIGRSVLRGLQLMAGGLGALAFADRESALAYLARA